MKIEIKNYAESQAAEAEKLLKELVVIPAPCQKEERKAAFCKDWLERRGALDVYVDEAGNVVYPYQVQHRDRLVVVMAHVDIPFAEEDKLLVTQKNRILEGPGTGDTGNLVAFLMTAAYFAMKQPFVNQGILFVATTGATGIGDLYGARQIMADYAGRIGTVISLQGYLGQCVHRFPGMVRYEVTMKRNWEAESDRRVGSVYSEDPSKDPIHLMSRLVCALYDLPIPSKGESKHRVSQFIGGSSPDTLAEQAGVVYEISSLDAEVLACMQNQAEACFHELEHSGNGIQVKKLAKRPCESMSVEQVGSMQELVNLFLDNVKEVPEEMLVDAGELVVADTEANLARVQGIPGISLGAIRGRRPGSQWEHVDMDSQRAGIALLLNLVMDVCQKQADAGRQVIYHDGLVMQGDTLLQVLDRHRKELILPSHVHAFAPEAFKGMEHLALWVMDSGQVADLSPVLRGKQMRLELGCDQEEKIMLPLTNIGGYEAVFQNSGVEGIDFAAYDARFSRIQDKNLQIEIAISRLLYPVGLTEHARNQYEQHVKKRYRPSMLRLMSGEWHRFACAPVRMTEVLALKKTDQFLQKELLEQAAYHGILREAPVSSAMVLSDRIPGLLPVCKRLEMHGRLEEMQPIGCYAHTLFHYVYGHPWWSETDPLWDLAADIAVNYLVDTVLGPERLASVHRENGCDGIGQESDMYAVYLARKAVYDALLLKQPVLTAEYILETLKAQPSLASEEICSLMCVDDHGTWPNGPISDGRVMEHLSMEERRLKEEIEEALKLVFQDGSGVGQVQQKQSGKAGTKAGNREDEANLNKREGQDYQEFLKQFMVCKEDRILDLDSFDPVYYTYGLTHYEDMPFVEPLETKEVNRLEELVIVIDTSGSCQGELVRFFLEETWSVFGHAENFFDQFHVRILQCDCVVQEDVKLTSLREVEDYMKHLIIRGGGGTDFRPAFRHIRELRRSGELGHLKGILYFTDGQGAYPEQVPDCETAFIFLEGRYESIKVPYWVKTLILQLPKDGSLKLEYSGEFRI